MTRVVGSVLVALWLCGVAGFVGGCASRAGMVDLDSGRTYPQDKPQVEVLDVQVLRDMAVISLTNTSARDLGSSTIWLNQEFYLDIPSFRVGETLSLNLTQFQNQYGRAFRAGGFFATERPKNVVLAQIEPSDSQFLLGLVVVDGVARR